MHDAEISIASLGPLSEPLDVGYTSYRMPIDEYPNGFVEGLVWSYYPQELSEPLCFSDAARQINSNNFFDILCNRVDNISIRILMQSAKREI